VEVPLTAASVLHLGAGEPAECVPKLRVPPGPDCLTPIRPRSSARGYRGFVQALTCDDARAVVAGTSLGRCRSRSVEQGAGPARKSVRLEAPRLARVARWWVAGSGRNLSAGPVPNIVRPFAGVRAVKTSSRSPTTCGFLRSGWSCDRVYAVSCPFSTDRFFRRSSMPARRSASGPRS
jgi:hypothetical protein